MSGFDDADLVAKIPILRRHASVLWRVRDAEDLVQETCERALRKRHLFVPGDLGCWLLRMMWRLRIDWARAEREFNDPILDRPVAPNQNAVVAVNELVRAIGRMTQPGAPLLIPAALGCTEAEIASTYNLRHGTLQSRLSRARCALRQDFDA